MCPVDFTGTKTEKAINLSIDGFLMKSGGAEGTRTLGLRRDRPAL